VLPERRVAARAVHKRTVLFMGCGFDDVKIVFFNKISKDEKVFYVNPGKPVIFYDYLLYLYNNNP
jgi:hypothetical protein